MNEHGLELGFTTPYDHLMPVIEDPAGQFYIKAMLVYLAMCDGIITPSEASEITARLKRHPEFTKVPIDPSCLPISSVIKNRLLENLETLQRYNLTTLDALRSAFSFAFVITDAPINEIDLKVLKYFAKNPTATFTQAASVLEMGPRGISHAIDRLRSRQLLRFSSLLDTSAFGINSFMLFFKLSPGVRWEQVESGLADFPFTKGLLRTTVGTAGYASFLFPGGRSRIKAFSRSIDRLRGTIFSEATLHGQVGMSRDTNLDLLNDGTWSFPSDLELLPDPDEAVPPISSPPVLWCIGPNQALTPFDFTIASLLRVNYRQNITELTEQLRTMGFRADTSMVAFSLRKIQQTGVTLPFLAFGGIGLSTNFCFEIICNKQWRDRILSFTSLLPTSITYISDAGLIVWVGTPSNHQAEYYKIFHSLELLDGVDIVNPILAVGPSGSRNMADIGRYWSSSLEHWSVDPALLDLSQYIP